MTEHQKLKEICDKIGFEEFNYWDECWNWFSEYLDDIDNYRIMDVREIIFTEEFMNKYWGYIYINDLDPWYFIFIKELMENLKNPVNYLYNQLKDE